MTCRYEVIKKEYPNTEPQTLFSTQENINVQKKELDIGVVVAQNNEDKLTINIEKLQVAPSLTEKHEVATTIDITELQKDYPNATVENGAKLSFVPIYKYEHLEPLNYAKFFTTYFPVFKTPEKIM